jgi:hypothetical protein
MSFQPRGGISDGAAAKRPCAAAWRRAAPATDVAGRVPFLSATVMASLRPDGVADARVERGQTVNVG